jgi:hypothetical protein
MSATVLTAWSRRIMTAFAIRPGTLPAGVGFGKGRFLCCPSRVGRTAVVQGRDFGSATNKTRSRALTAKSRPLRRVTAQLPFDDGTPDINELNRLEVERRALVEAQKDIAPRLTDSELELLFQKCPAIRRVNDYIEHALVSTPGLDPESPDVFTWALPLVQARRPPFIRIGALAYGLFVLVRRFLAVLRVRYLPEQIAVALACTDMVTTFAIAGVLASMLLFWAMVKESDHSDAQRRLSLTFSLTSLILPAAAALGASGYESTGLLVGAVGRLIVLPLTLWMWSDLSQEIFVMRVLNDKPVAYAFSAWRWLTTIFVCVFGGVLRVVAYAGRTELPLREIMLSRALELRLRIVQRFPVAMSLFGDPGGLAFLAGIVITTCFTYGLYVLMFACDFMTVRMHRRTNSLFSNVMISKGVYMPNLLKERESLLNTGPPGVKPHFPMRAMMLREGPALFGASSSVVEEKVPPLFELMEEEEAMMERKGMSRWNPPRTEHIPVSKYLTAEQRSRNFLRTWARPMEDPDSVSFSDFFEGVDDEQEYVYDPNSENWVFAPDSKWSTQRSDDEPDDTITTSSAPVEGSPEEGPKATDHPDLRNLDAGTVV